MAASQGYFEINNQNTYFDQSALYAVNSGGNTSKNDNYGEAGIFEITNQHNMAPALFVKSNGPGYTLQASDTGYVGGTAIGANDYSGKRSGYRLCRIFDERHDRVLYSRPWWLGELRVRWRPGLELFE